MKIRVKHHCGRWMTKKGKWYSCKACDDHMHELLIKAKIRDAKSK